MTDKRGPVVRYREGWIEIVELKQMGSKSIHNRLWITYCYVDAETGERLSPAYHGVTSMNEVLVPEIRRLAEAQQTEEKVLGIDSFVWLAELQSLEQDDMGALAYLILALERIDHPQARILVRLLLGRIVPLAEALENSRGIEEEM